MGVPPKRHPHQFQLSLPGSRRADCASPTVTHYGKSRRKNVLPLAGLIGKLIWLVAVEPATALQLVLRPTVSGFA